MGKIKIGDQLDSIKIMAETYAVSENTIRNVIEMLAERGFISTKSGKNSILVFNSGNLKQSLEYFLARKKQFESVYLNIVKAISCQSFKEVLTMEIF